MSAKRYLQGLSILTIYWSALFLIFRLLFIYTYRSSIDNYSSVLIYGYFGDLSIIMSLVAITSLIILFWSQKNEKLILKTLKIYSLISLSAITLVEYSSNLLYSEWGSTLTWRATSYLGDGIYGWQSAITSINFYLIFYFVVAIGFYFVFTRLIDFFFTTRQIHRN